MSKTLTLSDAVYDRLCHIAAEQGLPGVEALLTRWSDRNGPSPRPDAIARIRQLHAEMSKKYGPQPDSTGLIREDRDR